MTTVPTSLETFQHVRITIGVVLGLAITRALTGLAGFIQHPARDRLSFIHISWALTLLLTCMNFWWRELGLMNVQNWTFAIYLFLVSSTTMLFLLCTILFPNTLEGYSGYEDFFLSRRKWFFGIFALMVMSDVVDTLIKGRDYYESFAHEYLFRVPLYLIACGIAIWTPNRRFHQVFVLAGLLYQISWIIRVFNDPSPG